MNHRHLLAATLGVVLAASSCHRSATPASVPTTPAVTDCPSLPPGAEALLATPLVMVGEFHGTKQAPAFVGALVCHALLEGRRVRVGLELPRGEQASLDAYLGGLGSREDVLEGPHWTRPDQDGRSSVAMMELIDDLRRMRAGGLEVSAIAIDVDDHGVPWNDRDTRMAERVLAAMADDTLVVTLTGNLHNRIVGGLPWDPTAVPMGVHVLQAQPDARSLDLRYTGGTAWACQERCGVAEIAGVASGTPARVEFADDDAAYHGFVAVGAIEASPPATGG